MESITLINTQGSFFLMAALVKSFCRADEKDGSMLPPPLLAYSECDQRDQNRKLNISILRWPFASALSVACT